MLRPFKPDPDIRDRLLMTPLFYASRYNNFEILRKLSELGPDGNAKDRGAASVLYASIGIGSLDIVKFLIEKGAILKVNEKDPNLPMKKFPLIKATQNCHDEVVEYLLGFEEVRNQINGKCKGGNTALHYACFGKKCSKNFKTLNK